MKKNNEGMILNQLNKKDIKKLAHYCSNFKDYLIVDSCFKELNVAMRSDNCQQEDVELVFFIWQLVQMEKFYGVSSFG